MQSDPRRPTDAAPSSADAERAIARYLYLLRTAPPEAIEQVHADAFGALGESRRRELLERIGQVLPPYERALATPVNGTPVGLARLITRAEMRRPGTVRQLFGPGVGVGTAVGASLLGGIAGAVAASALAAPFLAAAAIAAAPRPGVPAPVATPSPGDPGDPGAGPADDLVADLSPPDDAAGGFGLDDLFDA